MGKKTPIKWMTLPVPDVPMTSRKFLRIIEENKIKKIKTDKVVKKAKCRSLYDDWNPHW